MKKFCESLREHAKEIINSKKMKLLTNKQQKSDKNAEKCYNWREDIKFQYVKDKKIT